LRIAAPVVRFPYVQGEMRIATPGTLVVELPAGPLNAPWCAPLRARVCARLAGVTSSEAAIVDAAAARGVEVVRSHRRDIDALPAYWFLQPASRWAPCSGRHGQSAPTASAVWPQRLAIPAQGRHRHRLRDNRSPQNRGFRMNTKQRLAQRLESLGPHGLTEHARKGLYSDLKGTPDTAIQDLGGVYISPLDPGISLTERARARCKRPCRDQLSATGTLYRHGVLP
jgi:hypothetical protein